jgi:hypothetical protein
MVAAQADLYRVKGTRTEPAPLLSLPKPATEAGAAAAKELMLPVVPAQLLDC